MLEFFLSLFFFLIAFPTIFEEEQISVEFKDRLWTLVSYCYQKEIVSALTGFFIYYGEGSFLLNTMIWESSLTVDWPLYVKFFSTS